MIASTYDREHLTALLILLKHSYDLTKTNGLKKIGDLDPGDLQIHHIFPVDLLNKVYGKAIEDTDIETAADWFANITIISSTANKRIGNKRPDEYLKDFDDETIRSHYIPSDEDLWKPKKFKEFIEKRRELLRNELNKLISL